MAAAGLQQGHTVTRAVGKGTSTGHGWAAGVARAGDLPAAKARGLRGSGFGTSKA